MFGSLAIRYGNPACPPACSRRRRSKPSAEKGMGRLQVVSVQFSVGGEQPMETANGKGTAAPQHEPVPDGFGLVAADGSHSADHRGPTMRRPHPRRGEGMAIRIDRSARTTTPRVVRAPAGAHRSWDPRGGFSVRASGSAHQPLGRIRVQNTECRMQNGGDSWLRPIAPPALNSGLWALDSGLWTLDS